MVRLMSMMNFFDQILRDLSVGNYALRNFNQTGDTIIASYSVQAMPELSRAQEIMRRYDSKINIQTSTIVDEGTTLTVEYYP